MAHINTLTDDFHKSSLTTSKWDQYTAGGATFTYTNGVSARVNYPASSDATTDGDLTSDVTYDITGGHLTLHVIAVPSSATAAIAYLAATDGVGTNTVEMHYEAGLLYAIQIVGGVQTNLTSVAYSSSSHAWWRIRESGGTTYWETSTNGVSWNTLYSKANPITMTALYAQIAGICYKAESNPGTFEFDYFNPLGQSPSASVSPSISPSGSMSPSSSTSPSRSPSSSASPSSSISASYSPSASPSPSASISPSASASLSPSASSSPSASNSPSASLSPSVSPSSSTSPSASLSSSISSSPSAAFTPPEHDVKAIYIEDEIIAVKQPDTDLRIID